MTGLTIEFPYIVAFVLPVIILAVTIWRSGYGAASSMVSFTFIWFLAFPIRTFLVKTVQVPIQAPERATADSLSIALLVSCLFLVSVALGYFVCARSETPIRPLSSRPGDNESLFWKIAVLMLVTALVSTLITVDYAFDSGVYVEKLYGSAMSYRPGNGWYFFLAETATHATVALFAWASVADKIKHKWVLSLLLVIAIGASLAMMFFLNTRRPVAFIMLMSIVVIAIRIPRLRVLIPLALVASLLGGQILQIARFSCVACLITESRTVGDESQAGQTANAASNQALFNTIVVTSSSYEGADHLAIWWEKTSLTQKLTGVDHGTSWLFNAALSLIPRKIWPEKPLVYGSVGQQAFLYPETFRTSDYATLPPSFIVDFSHGFGVPFGLAVAFTLGMGLRQLDRNLFEKTGFLSRALAIYVFINMFNVIRSGTGVIQGIVLFSILCLFVILPLRVPFGRKKRAG